MNTTADTTLPAVWLGAYNAISEMVRELTEARKQDDDNAIEAVQRTIQEDPLEVTVRPGWYAPGSEPGRPVEFCILLGTGGPASRIVGRLSEHGEPENAFLEAQDWGTEWTDCLADTELNATEVDRVLLTYCREHYFGE